MNALLRQSLQGFATLIVMLAACLFIPAGTLDFWQAWLYLGVFAGCTILTTLYLLCVDQDLLKRRLSGGPAAETQRSQQRIQALASVAFVGTLAIPGLDQRYRWSAIPPALAIAGAAAVALGFFVIFLVFRENSFTSATVEVAAGQRVIRTGPYSIVRHPMYAGAVVMFVATPVALGSYYGELATALLIVALAWRLTEEERFLGNALPGYVDYQEQVRYRLIPGVW